MAAESDNIVWYTYTGEEGEIIPLDATHIFASVRIILSEAFLQHENIVEVICHEDVEQIEEYAFYRCRSLRRVIMPGVKFVGTWAFCENRALTDVECGKLEIVGENAFGYCKSLRSINLPSARIVKDDAFGDCLALTELKFGSKLERIGEMACCRCTSLERITIPLKYGVINGMIIHENTFMGCENLKHVDLVEGELHETIAALHLETWRNRMNEVIDQINQSLPNAAAGYHHDYEEELDNVGRKAVAIRHWIRSIVTEIRHYKSEHRFLLNEDVVPTLKRVLPKDIVMDNVLPFLELPSYTI